VTPLQQQWLLAGGALLAALLLGFAIRGTVLNRLARLFARTDTDLDDLLLAVIRRHLPIWAALAGVALAARLAPLSERVALTTDRLCAVGLILSLCFAAAGLGAGLLERYTRRAQAGVAATSLVQNVLRVAIFACGALLVLANLGVSITPLLTALGVGSLAVALALQPTLSNLFAGIHLALARPIHVGDFVALESGQEGHVEDIGWRATTVRALANNRVVVPNARLADMVLTNYSQPEPEQAVLVQVGVSYDSDLPRVERVTCEVARELLRELPEGVPTFEPFIRYHTFGDSSINFTVILRATAHTARYLLIHEFVKRLHECYRREGIEIPFPQRVMHGPSRAARIGETVPGSER